jgi:hypothetical protein
MTSTRADRPLLVVLHPLDDAPEVKLDPARAGRMHLTRSVKWSLFALRAYLTLIMLLVAYRVYVLAKGR